ncbi:exodeoxyribonuclease VII large subunit [Candidatus Electronema sp. PJ]|uniref:exodeoxyribonuclease VII large subunit n=1 Tax=Candidatus Electronema sp. PJ TaxID=3401572 RepID=UPI003AA91BF9
MPSNQHIFSVAELATAIRSVLEGCFALVSVSGEISNLRQPASAHLYFTLKDKDAQLKAVLFRMQRRYLERQPKDGDRVICRGRLSVYEQRGDYQLIVESLEFQGAGSLHLAFAQLKHRLSEEGLFAEENKKPLPSLPGHITLVTSPSGAAAHDFIRVALDRCPQTRISIYPAAVQGEKAAGELRAAIAEINQQAERGRLDTEIIVLCRGGGSFEDLAAFNDEQLAREIRRSTIPVVSAVGHEIDFTIADFAADLRAPTPSAAAEMLLPDNAALAARTAELARRLHRAMNALLAEQQTCLAQLAQRLHQYSPGQRLELYQQKTGELQRRLVQAIKRLISAKEQELAQAAGLLDVVSPLATLGRGYAVARKKKGAQPIITAGEQVQPGEEIEVLLWQGRLSCVIEAVEL